MGLHRANDGRPVHDGLRTPAQPQGRGSLTVSGLPLDEQTLFQTKSSPTSLWYRSARAVVAATPGHVPGLRFTRGARENLL